MVNNSLHFRDFFVYEIVEFGALSGTMKIYICEGFVWAQRTTHTRTHRKVLPAKKKRYKAGCSFEHQYYVYLQFMWMMMSFMSKEHKLRFLLVIKFFVVLILFGQVLSPRTHTQTKLDLFHSKSKGPRGWRFQSHSLNFVYNFTVGNLSKGPHFQITNVPFVEHQIALQIYQL